MTEKGYEDKGELPVVSERELVAMNQLMADKQYKIKLPGNFLMQDRTDRVNSDFIMYTLNDYMGHLQQCVASTRKILPAEGNENFLRRFSAQEPMAFRVLSITAAIDIKQLSSQVLYLQGISREVTVVSLVPFMRLLFQSLIRIYYLGAPRVASLYRASFAFITKELVPTDLEGFRSYVANAIEEWYYILGTLVPGLYPLLLRMCSPVMLGMQPLFYANGSRLLTWLSIEPGEVLFSKEPVSGTIHEQQDKEEQKAEESIGEEEEILPDEVCEGLENLEQLFPEAGWQSLESFPDMCPYFQSILQFEDGFIQLAPENPLHLTFVLFWILEELFQGLRQIHFLPLAPTSIVDDVEDINRILDEWILYHESVFDKTFSSDLKAYTHQIYTQADFSKTPYGRKLLSSMYTQIKSMFLPYFDVRMYGSARATKDDRLAPFFTRVQRLKKMLDRYYEAIESAPSGSDLNPDGMVSGLQNPWAPYKFDISNIISRRLDALCGGKHSKARTNAMLIKYTRSILNVLDWWINSKDSYAYRTDPDYLYRTVAPDSPIPAFGINTRTDVDALFIKHLKMKPPVG